VNPNAADAAAAAATAAATTTHCTILAVGHVEPTAVAAIATSCIARSTTCGGCRAGGVRTRRSRPPGSTFASSTTVRAQRARRFNVNRAAIEQDGASASAGTSTRIDERRCATTTTCSVQRSAHVDRPQSGYLKRPTAVSGSPAYHSYCRTTMPPRASAPQRHDRAAASRHALATTNTVPTAAPITSSAAGIPKAATTRAATCGGCDRRSLAIVAEPTRAFLRVIGPRASRARAGTVNTRRNVDGPCDRRVGVHDEHERVGTRDRNRSPARDRKLAEVDDT
jgi:hypothetical protein